MHILCRVQREVSDALSEMGIPHSVEGKISHPILGNATVDILIQQSTGPPVALEVDGPLHFLALPPYSNLGHTVLRNRLLEAR